MCTMVLCVLGGALSAGCGFDAAVPGRERALTAQRCDGLAGRGARCASLTVLENRDQPAGRTIPLRIIVLPATGRAHSDDPVFFLAGGPGQAATDFVREAAIADAALREDRDLVFVDQRGTGGSSPLTCRFYGPPDEAASYFTEFLPPGKVRDCRRLLEPVADLTQYTTAASVDDLDEVRAALGYERINLIGGSYGTRLAMEYVRRYERHVRAVILEGAVPPSVRMPENFGRDAQRALDALLDECSGSRACSAAFPALGEDVKATFDRLGRGSVSATVRHPAGRRDTQVRVTRDHVGEAIRYMTYSARDAAGVPYHLHQAARQNFSPIAQFLMDRRAHGTFSGLYLSVTCAEDVPFISDDAAERDEGTYLGGYRVRQQRAACDEWPRGRVPAWHGQPVASAVPVLIISGMLDPATPPEYGDEVARTLSNSLHVRIPHAGHSPAGLSGLGCLTTLRGRFLQTARTDDLDASCLASVSRPSFAIR